MRGAFVSLAVLLGLVGQAAEGPGRTPTPTFSSGTDLVVLSATALDRHGRPVTDLRPEELRVYEGRRQQALDYFAHARDLPARILLLVDASGSMHGELKTASARMAVIQMLAALGPDDRAALAGFDHRYFGLARFGTDRRALLNAFDGLEFFGSTALHDALERAASDVASLGEGRRAVVIITDGVDTASHLTPEEVIARSRALDVPIYAISVVSPVDDPASDRYLRAREAADGTRGAALLTRYATLSGGEAFTVSDVAGLRRAAGAVAGQLKHQYRLGYHPPAGPSGFRRVEVRATRKGVSVRTRAGYLSQP